MPKWSDEEIKKAVQRVQRWAVGRRQGPFTNPNADDIWTYIRRVYPGMRPEQQLQVFNEVD